MGWPKRLEWIEVDKIRGWCGQRINLNFPIVAIVGRKRFRQKHPSAGRRVRLFEERPQGDMVCFRFFPRHCVGSNPWRRSSLWLHRRLRTLNGSFRKPTTRWLGNVDRPTREVEYIDLSRIQPVSARVGYARIAKNKHEEKSHVPFEEEKVRRLSEVMGRHYDAAKMSITTIDEHREIPVISRDGNIFSGFHQGSGGNNSCRITASRPSKERPDLN